MTLVHIPELVDGPTWLKAGLTKRFSVYQRLSQALGAEWAVSRVGAEPRVFDPLRASQVAGLSLIHQPSTLAFRLVPGFTFQAGFAAGELDSVRAALHEAALAEGVVASLGVAEGARTVEVAPFLLCASPVRIAQLGALIRLDGVQAVSDGGGSVARVALFRPPEATAALASGPFRLPTSLEWESAYRAGSQRPFPWGDEIPESLASVPAHPLDIADFAVFPEGTEDAGTASVRGGVVAHAPWTIADAGWAGLLSGLRAPWGPDAIATIRPVCPLVG